MKTFATKGRLHWSHTLETELAGGYVSTITISGVCEYSYTPGSPAQMYERHGVAPHPEEPADREYYNFKGTKVETALWTDTQTGRRYLYDSKVKPTHQMVEFIGDWFEAIVNNKDNNEGRDYLDGLLNEELDGKFTDDWDD